MVQVLLALCLEVWRAASTGVLASPLEEEVWREESVILCLDVLMGWSECVAAIV